MQVPLKQVVTLPVRRRNQEPGGTSYVAKEKYKANYYLAKTYATAGKMQEFLTYLRKALEAGFKTKAMKDKEFAALCSTPEFHQLMMQQTAGE
jgi:hypothetical protein